MNLHQYLVAIEEHKAINLTRFKALLPPEYKQNWRNIFSYTPALGKDKYILSVNDEPCFRQLLQLTKPSNNRVDASTQGDSHQHNTSMSFLLVYANVTLQAATHKKLISPTVVVSDGSALTMDFTCQKTLVIIENQENFFRYQEFLPKLVTIRTQVDIAFGQGNSVTNTLNAKFFAQYQQILCCFDYDLGGLTMFSSLIKLTSAKPSKTKLTNTKLSLVLPSKACLHRDEFLNSHFKKMPKQDSHWRQAITLAEQLGFTDLAQAFNRSKKFMEQEVYLSDPNLRDPSFCQME
ncbi:MAG: hypothetical protein V5789_12845 [Colwellia sp.]